MTHRGAQHARLSAALADLSDEQLADQIRRATAVHSGIGGASVRALIEGVPVFVKQVPLTHPEHLPDNIGSTRNFHHLPPAYHYGIGSAGFSAWRELAAHQRLGDPAVKAHEAAAPMLYHWRLLEQPPPTRTDDDDIDAMVQLWGGSPAIRERLTALDAAQAQLVLCCEFIPQTLDHWLADQANAGTIELVIGRIERQLLRGVTSLRRAELVHFDAHFTNILTDGDQLYFADFGLACSPTFDLDPDEADFLDRNATHDACYVITHLVNWLVSALVGLTTRPDRVSYIQRCANGSDPWGLPTTVSRLVARYAPIAAVFNDFYGALPHDSLRTPYPASRLSAACAAAGLEPLP